MIHWTWLLPITRMEHGWILPQMGGNLERTLFDVRVFNPYAPTNRCVKSSSCYRKHEQVKKRAYEQRVREIEHASFTPLVLSATGGLASTFYKRLASSLFLKWDQPYSCTLRWLRCRLGFSLLRSAIQSIRGARSSRGQAIKTPTVVDLVNAEVNFSCFSSAYYLLHDKVAYSYWFCEHFRDLLCVGQGDSPACRKPSSPLFLAA